METILPQLKIIINQNGKTNWPVYQENIKFQLTQKEIESELDPIQINKIINKF